MKTWRRHLLVSLLASSALLTVETPGRAGPPSARQFYVATNGSAAGDGSLAQPWDLQTALNHPSVVQPGDTINLRGGTYWGHYISNLAGSSSAPITVQSYPGEWARIDGHTTTTLSANLTGTDTTVALVSTTYVPSGSVVAVEDEQLYLFNKTTGNSYSAVRGWNGTTPAAHSLGATVAAVGNMVVVNGSDAIYRDFEVLDSNPTRIYKTTGDPSVRRGGDGLFVYGPRVKLVNLLVHDNQDGIFMAVRAVGAEAYGCLVYNNGHSDPARGEGHGLYLQNQDSSQPKKITDSVFFNNFAVGAKAYGETSPSIGIEFTGNISFNNGAPASFPGNPSGFSSDYRQPNLFVGNGSVPPDHITVTSNYLYDPPGTMVGGNLRLSYVTSGGKNLVVKDNYVAGGHQAISVGGYSNVQVTGNTFFASELSSNSGTNETLAFGTTPSTYAWTWDDNTYFDDTGSPYSFSFNQATNASGGGNLEYSETPSDLGKGWKEWTGFDAHSTYTRGRPAGTKIVVRPNRYEAGRAHIAVYNWDQQNSVTVDLAGVGLAAGDRYTIYDVQNYPAPLLAGTYTGGAISIPMTGPTVVKPIGFTEPLASTLPEFGVFLIRKSVPAAGTTAPLISAVSSSAVSSSAAAVNWTTDGQSDSQVEYGTTAAYGLTTTFNAALVTAHFQGLSGLAPGTTYHFRVKSKDASGNLATSGDFSFTTGAAPDTTPPVISAVSSSPVSGASATVTWTTKEESDSQVEYGASAAYGSSTALNAAPVTSHSQGLTGLGAGVTYHFRVKSRDAAGNLATSGDFTFTTTAGATTPVISGVSTTGITGTSATIRWSTNAATDSQVQYGTATGYGSTTTLDSSLTTTHSQSLSGLTAGTTYHFRVKSKDAAGNLATSADYQFMTASPLDQDLVAGYAFDEGSGTTTADYSGNSNIGTLFNVSWTKGKYGSALRFNGTDGYVTAPGTGLPAMNAPQTTAFWFNASARTTSTQPVVSFVDERLHISIQPGFKESQIGVWQNPGNWLVAAVPPSTNLWHHIAHTYDGRTHRLYVDGKQVGNSTIAPTAATPTGLQIGRMIDGSGYLKGSLDELRIYRRALTQADIRSLMLQSFVGVRQTCCGSLRTP